MSWKKEFPGLYKRLRRAAGNPSELALDKRITRATKAGLTSKEALFVIASKYNLGFAREFSSLPIESQAHVNTAIMSSRSNLLETTNGAKGYVKKGSRFCRTVSLSTPLGVINDPYLPSSMTIDAVDMSRTAYPYFYILENSIRNFISLVLVKKYGSNWWTLKVGGTKSLDKISEKAIDRTKKEKRFSYHGKRGVHQIYYVDFDDLIILLAAFQPCFNPYFTNLPGKLNGLLIKLEELVPSRNIIAHNNPLSKEDKSRLSNYLHYWLAQLKYLKENGLL